MSLQPKSSVVGVPKEIKNNEFRVGMVPDAVKELTKRGIEVMVESGAGEGAGFNDEAYVQAGAILGTVDEVFDVATLIVKVKEPQPEECRRLKAHQVLFTYLHLAPDPEQTQLLQASGATAIAYETVTSDGQGLPLLTPMSEVAGRLSIQAGARCLEKVCQGRGMLLGGVPGVLPAKVSIIGGGVVGTNALKMAIGLGAEVTLLDNNLNRLRALDDLFGARVKTLYSTSQSIESTVIESDLVIGAILVPGAAAPKLIKREHIAMMKPGAVIVDVAIDQGGCADTSKPTTYADPTYVVDNVVHYCVANMPGGVSRTSTLALNQATLPYIVALAEKGAIQAMKDDTHLRAGLNVMDGKITYEAVARVMGQTYHAAESVYGNC